MPVLWVKLGGGRGQRYYNNQWNPQRLCCCCCCVSNCRLCTYTVMSFTIARFFEIAQKPGVCSHIPSPMQSKHGIVNIKYASFSGCVCLISIPGGGDSWLFSKISFERFFLKRCCEYSFNTLESIPRFGFKNKAGNAGKIKPFSSRSTMTVVLVHSNMVINKGIEGYRIR